MKLEDLEKLRGQIESWLAAKGVPASEIGDLAPRVIDRAWDNRHQYDPNEPLEPWVRAIAKRVALGWHRATATHAALAYRLLEDERTNWSPDRQYILKELLKSLSDAIGSLDRESRALLNAHHYDGRSLPQLSEELGVPESTLNKRLMRARAAIREFLAHRGITDPHLVPLPFTLQRELFRHGSGRSGPAYANRNQETRDRRGTRAWPAYLALALALVIMALWSPPLTCVSPRETGTRFIGRMGVYVHLASLKATYSGPTPAPQLSCPSPPEPVQVTPRPAPRPAAPAMSEEERQDTEALLSSNARVLPPDEVAAP